jgi:hypothetical protein
VILDTRGNIFDGFTPVEWESRVWNRKYRNEDNCFKADANLKNFLFTLKNPHNVPAWRFALKPEMKDEAIYYYSDCGPDFCDIGVSDTCNVNISSCNYLFGNSYTNDTGLDERTFFTGSERFEVKEIEVLEITG